MAILETSSPIITTLEISSQGVDTRWLSDTELAAWSESDGGDISHRRPKPTLCPRELRQIDVSRGLPRPPMQLTLLDEFLRCRERPISELLAKFLESRGSVHPAYHANNLIDQLSFTAATMFTKHAGT
jgi:hypothetical protein